MHDEVTVTEIAGAVHRLGVAGHAVCVHASLRSFPTLSGGPETLVEGLRSTGATVMVATMAGDAFAMLSTEPAAGDRLGTRRALAADGDGAVSVSSP